MSGFTDDEVAASIDRFIRQVVSVPLLTGDSRDVISSRDRVYDLLTTSLVLKPASIFYLIWLARNVTAALITQQIEAVDEIIEAAPNVNRSSRRIASTTELTNARAAITDLTAGLSARTVGVQGSLGPGVDRFNRSVEKFLRQELAPNVVVDGEAVSVSEELRATIQSLWTEGRERHVDILTRLGSLVAAIDELAAIALPQQTIASIVAKIGTRLSELETTLATTAGVKESRLSMLDLLTMRSLLRSVSSFSSPVTVLAPRARDTAEAEMIDSAGDEAALLGSKSAPYNFDPASILDLSVNGSPVSVPLSGTSQASVRSAPLTFPSGPTLPAEIAIDVDFFTPVVVDAATASPPWASGPAAAAALGAVLGPSVLVSWDVGTLQLVFSSANAGDDSSLRFLNDTADRQSFTDWAFPGYPMSARGEPVPLESILSDVGAATTLVGAEVVETFVGTFQGTVALGSPDIDLTVVDGSDGVSNGSTSFTSEATNFVLAGVKPGMAVSVTFPPLSSGIYGIVSVTESALVLDADVAADTGLVWAIGPDLRTVPAGTRIQLAGPADAAGYYRLTTPDAVIVAVDRNIPADGAVTVSVFSRALRVYAVGTTTTSSLSAVPSAGVTALGLPTGSTVYPSLTGFQTDLDLVTRGAQDEDLIHLVAPSGTEYDRVLVEVTMDSFVVDPAVPYEAGVWEYVVRSARGDAYDTMVEALNNVTVDALSDLDFAMIRLVRGANYTNDVSSTIEGYRSSLEDLLEALDGYAVPAESSIDSIIRMMEEQGFDRALDLLLGLDLRTLFLMNRTGVSYSTDLAAKSATVAREVVPVSKLARGGLVYAEMRPLSFQLASFDLSSEADTE